MTRYLVAHWGTYHVDDDLTVHPLPNDPAPSPIGLFQTHPSVDAMRVRRPSVRRSWLEHGPGARPERRGSDPFVELPWDEAAEMVAAELKRVISAHGNEAVFGGSYGWSSAGRFHHAQSQVHRFLNALGGYVRHADSYSLGAARVLMPHVVAPMDELMTVHSSWDVLARHCRLFVTFGGVPLKNAQVSAGGPVAHRVGAGLRRMAEAGTRFVNISPVCNDLETGAAHEWLAIRPNTDTALLLAIAFVLQDEGLHDLGFLNSHCVGFDRFLPYLTGAQDGVAKDPRWAEAITGIPAARIADLAREMAASRTMLNIAWALQRSDHGEQPFWALVTVAAMLGQIGLPGGGFGVGYGAVNSIGSPEARFGGPTLPQGDNAVKAFIPVARIADMLLNPGGQVSYNGQTLTYPDIKLIYWAGGNPFHHHQNLNRLLEAWRKPDTIVVHEQYWTPTAKLADIVLPATTSLERDDIGYATREGHLIAMKRLVDPVGEARDDYAIFADIAGRLDAGARFTEQLDSRAWLVRLYEESRKRAAGAGIDLPPFDAFWESGMADYGAHAAPVVMLDRFRADPAAQPLRTPSGKIEIFSETIAGFGYADCGGHATWYPPNEWLGAEATARFPLHLLSDQPTTRLHSQLDHSPHSRASKVAGREPVMLHPADAAARGIADGDVVRVFNDRGACLAGAVVSADIRQGVAKLSTGAWFDPDAGGLEKHGNPNAVTQDHPASSLSQGCAAQTCLVEIARHDGPLPPVTAYTLPRLE